MSTYMYQFSYTPETWKNLENVPEDRRIAVRELLDRLGGRLIEIYYTFDEFDGIVFFEAPNDIAAKAAIVDIFAPGHLKTIRATQLFTVEETMHAMHKSEKLSFEEIGHSHKFF
jgi:uncharacterized protein with GYD domain